MKNVKLLLVLLLIVNCTTNLPNEVNETSEILAPEAQNCVDDLPQVRITNNGVHGYNFLIYDIDDNYTTLYSGSIPLGSDSDWIELSSDNVVVIASNEFDYGQKAQLSLENCDTIEVEIDTNDTLTVL